jgi:hypothetical protein
MVPKQSELDLKDHKLLVTWAAAREATNTDAQAVARAAGHAATHAH